jgi:hypothetical protein
MLTSTATLRETLPTVAVTSTVLVPVSRGTLELSVLQPMRAVAARSGSMLGIRLGHALTQRRARLNPLFSALSQEFSREGRTGLRLTPAEAFVLTNAIAGVIRAVVTSAYPLAQRQAFEEALNRLVREMRCAQEHEIVSMAREGGAVGLADCRVNQPV